MRGRKCLCTLALTMAFFAGTAGAQLVHGMGMDQAFPHAAGAFLRVAAAEGDAAPDINEALNAMAQTMDTDGGLLRNRGWLIGIAVGVVIAVLLVVMLVLRTRKKPKGKKETDQGADAPDSPSAYAGDSGQDHGQDSSTEQSDWDEERTNSVYYASLNTSGAHTEERSGQFFDPMANKSRQKMAANEEYTTDPYAKSEEETINPYVGNAADEEETINPYTMQAKLYEVHLTAHEEGASAEHILSLRSGMKAIIGRRGNSDIVLSAKYVSRSHIEIAADDQGLTLRNLEEEKSAEYTRINGKSLTAQAVPLNEGDVVEIAHTRLVITQVRVEKYAR